MLKYPRIAVTVLSLTACVLLIAMWVRSYWQIDCGYCPLNAPRMLIVYSSRGGVSLYAGEAVPYRTGWFPSNWGMDSYSVKRRGQPETNWRYSSDVYGASIRFPYWL